MKKSLILALVLPLFFSCSKKWEGCTDYVALNFKENAEKDDGSCTYTTITFYADSTQYPGSQVSRVDVSIDNADLGSITTIYSPGSVYDCGLAGLTGTLTYNFEDAGQVNWTSTVHYTNGNTPTTRKGTAAPDSSNTCILINAL